MDSKKLLARNLKKYVKQSGKNSKTICRELHLPYYKYREWISENSVRMPHIETLVALSNYFGIQTADFFQDDTPSPLDEQTEILLKSIQEMEQEAIRTKKPAHKRNISLAILILVIAVMVIIGINIIVKEN